MNLVQCNYTAEYTVTFAYGPVNADSYNFTDSGGILGLHFYIKSYTSNWITEQDPSTTAGDTIYLKLQLNSTRRWFCESKRHVFDKIQLQSFKTK